MKGLPIWMGLPFLLHQLIVQTNKHIAFPFLLSTSEVSIDNASCHQICGEILFSCECCEYKLQSYAIK
jgi:hypothetical protein